MNNKELLEKHLYNVDQIKISAYCMTSLPCWHDCKFHLRDTDEWIETTDKRMHGPQLIMFYDIMNEEDKKHFSYLLDPKTFNWSNKNYAYEWNKKLIDKVDTIYKRKMDELEKKMDELKKQHQLIRGELYYAPSGEGYIEAKKNFEDLQDE
jgi:hypothetical protein